MGKSTFRQTIKEIIALACWRMFLWGIEMTDQQYWDEIYRAERSKRCVDYERANEKIANVSEDGLNTREQE